MSRRRRQSPPAPPPVAWPDLTPARDSKPEPESARSGLPFVEFMRIFSSVADVLDPHFKTGHLYTPDEIDRKIRAMEILRTELDHIIGRRDAVSYQTVESANRICPGVVLRFDSKRTPARNGNRS